MALAGYRQARIEAKKTGGPGKHGLWKASLHKNSHLACPTPRHPLACRPVDPDPGTTPWTSPPSWHLPGPTGKRWTARSTGGSIPMSRSSTSSAPTSFTAAASACGRCWWSWRRAPWTTPATSMSRSPRSSNSFTPPPCCTTMSWTPRPCAAASRPPIVFGGMRRAC